MTFNFDEKTINFILNALGAQPYITAQPIIDDIRRQGMSQLQAPVEDGLEQAEDEETAEAV